MFGTLDCFASLVFVENFAIMVIQISDDRRFGRGMKVRTSSNLVDQTHERGSNVMRHASWLYQSVRRFSALASCRSVTSPGKVATITSTHMGLPHCSIYVGSTICIRNLEFTL